MNTIDKPKGIANPQTQPRRIANPQIQPRQIANPPERVTNNMRKAIYYIFLSFLCTAAFGQSLTNGVYENKKSKIMVCIHDDTLFYRQQSTVTKLYYGLFSIVDGDISFGENLLVGKNTMIHTSKCDSLFMEIEVYELVSNILFGGIVTDTTPYILKSDLFTLGYNHKTMTINDTIARLSPSDFFPNTNEIAICVRGGNLSGYQDEVVLPIKKGCKYALTQKYYHCQPILNNLRPLVFVEKAKKNYKLKYYDAAKSKFVRLKYIRDCNSCSDELRKSYPAM